jgi:hypothetical protein
MCVRACINECLNACMHARPRIFATECAVLLRLRANQNRSIVYLYGPFEQIYFQRFAFREIDDCRLQWLGKAQAAVPQMLPTRCTPQEIHARQVYNTRLTTPIAYTPHGNDSIHAARQL